jgi:hypothetical protein
MLSILASMMPIAVLGYGVRAFAVADSTAPGAVMQETEVDNLPYDEFRAGSRCMAR